MPFFGKKNNEKKEKSEEAPSYPRQAAVPPPQVSHHTPMPSYPQGTFVQQGDQFYYSSAGTPLQTTTTTTVAFARTDLPGAYDNFAEGFLDGPDFSNRIPDPKIPPAPGSYYFYSHGNAPAGFAPYPGTMPSSSAGPSYPPPPPASSANLPPPPSYEQVLSQEVKEKL